MTSLTPRQARSAVDVRVTTRGAVSPAAPGYARAKVLVLLGRAHEPVLAARVKLSQESHHTVARPSVAQAMVDLLQDRLKVQLAKARQREHALPPAGRPADRPGAVQRRRR
ncbi:hypothetical protein, partial [Kitasatospora sp. NPDC047058]|uniref:hypothetical protein n=1 Tax=Kitasatospora sp. NPDC047058 TaxID=3155620 RepID=UPI0033ECF84E